MKTFFLFLFLAISASLPAAPVISEFLADNDGGMKDEDGDDADWIEIYNPDPAAVNLAGWRLTDDAALTSKWIFPPTTLQAGGRLIVWASNKNRDVGQLHTNFSLDQDGEYLALISPAGVVSTDFAPVFPFQTKNTTFGTGFSGAVTVTDGTPPTPVGGTHFSRVKLNGVGAAAQDGNSLNIFDDANPAPQHQQYLWFDYSSRLGAIPAGQTVVEATLEWSGENRLFAGVSGLNTVTTPVGIFMQPNDANRGITAIATGADGNDLVDFFAATTPYSSISAQQGESKNFLWNVTQLVKDWQAAPASPTYGKFIIVPGEHPSWFAWDQSRPCPKLTIRSQISPTPVVARGYMTPSPGAANSGVAAAGPLLRQLTENPLPPAPGAAFPVTAHIIPAQGGAVTTVSLIYRKHYDGETTVSMVDDGTNGDVTAGDNVYTGIIPSTQLLASQMIRWKVRATDAAGFQTPMPPYRDTLDSPQYFGTVPLDPSIVTPLFTLHRFIQVPSAAQNTTGTRGSVFLNGEFYDNIGINLHGQSTSGPTFLKKSYDIDGNRGYRFKWSMDPLQPRAKDINLLTVYGDKTKIRHGLAYEMARTAGVAAHYCISTHCRLNGVFDGVYDFVEDGDDVYLERAGLNKNGVLYKMYNGMSNAATDASVGAEKKSRKTESNLDLFLFLQGMNMADANARKAYLFDNVDLPKMINFMAVNTVTGNIDLHSKNYYIYSDSGKTNLWTLLPWDLDLSQGRLWTSWNNYFDDGIYLNAGGTISGTGQNLVARMYAVPELANMAKRRIRSLQDKFFKTSATAPDMTRWYDTRVSQMAAQFGASLTIGQNDTPGMDAALDFSKYAAAAWKNHTGTNNNTAASTFAANTMSLEIQRVMSSWVVQRINTINADTGNVPAAYNVAALTPLTFSVVEHSPASGDQDQEYIEITNPNVLHLDLSGWQITGGVTFTFEPGTVVNGNNKIYVAASRNAFKARTTGPRGGQSLNVTGGFLGHLSNLGETLNLLDDTGTQRATFSYTGSPTPHQQHLAVTEIMYNPGGSGQAEFIEITNLSSTETLGMGNVRFNAGVDFNFTGSPVTSLAPGARALIVKNLAAFTAIHGNSLPVAGEFLNSTGLNNTGEVLKLEDPGGNTVKEFAYSSLAPWPAANGTGSSIVLMRPELNPDPALPQNWRASIAAGGNPGADDAVRFSGIATGDVDADGLPAIVEYVLGTSDGSPGGFGFQPVMGTDGTGARIVDVTLLRRLNADDATFRLESSSDLTTWNPTGWALRTSTPAGSGMVSEQWRLTLTPSAPDKAYVRCSCSRR